MYGNDDMHCIEVPVVQERYNGFINVRVVGLSPAAHVLGLKYIMSMKSVNSTEHIFFYNFCFCCVNIEELSEHSQLLLNYLLYFIY